MSALGQALTALAVAGALAAPVVAVLDHEAKAAEKAAAEAQRDCIRRGGSRAMPHYGAWICYKEIENGSL